MLRGPFSALYGNSSGGVIAVFTEDARPGHSVAGTGEYGTFNTQRYAVKTTGGDGVVNYVVDAAHFQTDGYRFHSDAERNNFNVKLRVAASETSTVTVVANAIETPFVQDPLGLTRAQSAANPEQAGTGAIPFNTRKSWARNSSGLVFDGTLSGNDDDQRHRRTPATAPRRSSRQFRRQRNKTRRSILAESSIWIAHSGVSMRM